MHRYKNAPQEATEGTICLWGGTAGTQHHAFSFQLVLVNYLEHQVQSAFLSTDPTSSAYKYFWRKLCPY